MESANLPTILNMDVDVDGLAAATGLRVLIVEDDPSLGRLVQMVLSRHTSEVEVARTGGAALEAVANGSFDAIASDISLPDMSGIDIIARARELSPKAGIVAITGFVDVDVAVQAMKAGADDFLGKPFSAEILWHLLNKAVDNRRRRLEADQAEAYRELAYTDALTGCPNRRFIDEFMSDAVEQATRTGEPLAVAYFDIDNFKLLNDYTGHEQGDFVLRRVARELQKAIREPAVFGRFGGDEFVAVFPGATVETAQRSVEQVRDAVGHIEVSTSSRIRLPMRVSCGIAAFREGLSPRDLVADAEDKMYLDKSVSASLLAGGLEQAASEPMLKLSNLKALRNLVKAIDRRDSYTRFHSDHATRLALALGREVGYSQDELAALTLGGPIHDLGKIVVPDEILRKPGPLTAEERRTMEEHPLMGAAITAAVTDYDAVVDLVRHHHERFDGDGYPGRLRGTQILPVTRLFTLADAYSAMTTDRPYRKGLTAEQAIDEILGGRGTQFDPDLATAFVRMVERDFVSGTAAA
ncbi:MAG: diguanylate cyclase [Dehalococcoidia bacterium]|nr:diguanylate cyclase [Dehalococcoidia bacterium]